MRRVWLLLALLALLSVPTAAFADGPASTVRQDDVEAPASLLDRFRAVKEELNTAIRLEDSAERIAALDAFIEKNPDYYDLHTVLEKLLQTHVDAAPIDAERVGELALTLARDHAESLSYRPEQAFYVAYRYVDNYYLKHELRLEDALQLVEIGRKRAAETELEFDEDVDPRSRARREKRLRYYTEIAASLYRGRLRLHYGDPQGALDELTGAEKELASFENGLVARDGQGDELWRVSLGFGDRLRMTLALAHLRLGQLEKARSYATGWRSSFLDEPYKGWAEEVRRELKLERPVLVEALGDPEPAAPFSLDKLGGGTASLADYKGKVVLLAFWATWCGPCLLELPELQRFAREHADDGVVLVTINTDDFKVRESIPEFLEEQNLDIEVLFEDAKQLAGYSYSAIPALYILDRDGMIANARTGYSSDMKEKLDGLVLDLARGEATPGRSLAKVVAAPEGFRVLWQQPVPGRPLAVAIGEPIGDQGGEIAVLTQSSFSRWSATGEALGTKPQRGWPDSLRAADLDGDGRREWVVGGYRDIRVLDSEGEFYWTWDGRGRLKLQDVPARADGTRELLLTEGARLLSMGPLPRKRLEVGEIEDLAALHPNPAGGWIVEADGALRTLSPEGTLSEAFRTLGDDEAYVGRIRQGEQVLDLYRGDWDASVEVKHDLDGDGAPDVTRLARGIAAFDLAGRELLRIEPGESGHDVVYGDLDGKPGDEVVLFVQHYGLVVLGRE